jgi:hypothetical protein
MIPSDICVVLAAQSIRSDYPFYADDVRLVLAQLGFEVSIPQIAAGLRRTCLLDTPPVKVVEKSSRGNSYEVTPAGRLWLRNQFPGLERVWDVAAQASLQYEA